MVEKQASRSSVHLRLPRPTVVKGSSPMSSELTWELPSLYTRQRRRSNPTLLPEQAPGTSSPDSSLSTFQRSSSVPGFKLVSSTNEETSAGRYVFVSVNSIGCSVQQISCESNLYYWNSINLAQVLNLLQREPNLWILNCCFLQT